MAGLAVGPRRLELDGRTLGSIAYLALAGSVAGFSLLYWLLTRITAVSASLLNLALPILALIEGWAVYGERLNLSLALGSAVVAAGIGLASVRLGGAPIDHQRRRVPRCGPIRRAGRIRSRNAWHAQFTSQTTTIVPT